MKDELEFVLRAEGLQAEDYGRLSDVLANTTGTVPRYVGVAPGVRQFDLEALGVSLEGVGTAISTIALYFQLRHARKRSEVTAEEVIDAVAEMEKSGEALEVAQEVASVAVTYRVDSDEPFTIELETIRITVDFTASIVMLTIEPSS